MSERPELEFKPRYQRFVIGNKKSFEVQYSHLYQKRLRQMKESVKRSVEAKFGKRERTFKHIVLSRNERESNSKHDVFQ